MMQNRCSLTKLATVDMNSDLQSQILNRHASIADYFQFNAMRLATCDLRLAIFSGYDTSNTKLWKPACIQSCICACTVYVYSLWNSNCSAIAGIAPA